MNSINVTLISAHSLLAELSCKAIRTFSEKIDAHLLIVSNDSELNFEILESYKSDVVLVSSGISNNGLGLARTLRNKGYQVPVIIICLPQTIPSLTELQEIGVQGIISTSMHFHDLEAAIYAVINQQANVLRKQYHQCIQLLEAFPEEISLTQREIDVLQLVANDLTDEQTAHKLGLAATTVRNHLKRIYEKMNTKRIGAVLKAVNRGIINYP